MASLVLAVGLVGVSGCGGAESPPAAEAGNGGQAASPAGNGIEKVAADEALRRVVAASSAATSVHVKGVGKEEGETIKIDLNLSRSSAAGSIEMGTGRIEVIRIGTTSYIKGDKKFLTAGAGAEAAKTLAGKYMKVEKGSQGAKDFEEFTSLTEIPTFFKEMLQPEGAVTQGGVEKVNGRPAAVLKDGTQGKLYAATQGEPHALRITDEAGNALDFTYGAPVEAKAPPSGKVVPVP